MFCNKRNSLVKRLWKYKINDETKSSSQKDTSASSSSINTTTLQEDLELKSVTHSFFKRLKEEQLKTLVQAMESKGGEVTLCVSVSKSDLRLGRRMVSPYVLCCRVFRWPDLKSDVEMKRLPSCTQQNEERESVICCNPYHWSLLVKVDEPPIHPDKLLSTPKQARRTGNEGIIEEEDPRIMKSRILPSVSQDGFTGNTEQSTGCDCLLWCTVAYWELQERVGRLFSVTEPSVQIFQHLPHGDGMCLRLLQKPTNLAVVNRTREKIGFGIILSREASHKNSACPTRSLETEEEVTNSALAAGTGVLCSLRSLSSSAKQMSPPRGTAENVSNRQTKCSSLFPSTSYSQTVTSPYDVANKCDHFNILVHGDRGCGGGEDRVITGCDGQRFEHFHDEEGCITGQNQTHRHLHVECVSDEAIDDRSATFMPSPQFYNNPHQQQSRSPSTIPLSSSSSSLPLYINDTCVSYSHYAGLKNEARTVNKATEHIINNRANNYVTSNNKSNKRATTGVSSESSSKNSRTMVSHIIPASTQTTTSNFTSASSFLPSKQGEIWAYNASDFPIFVNSPTLDDPQSPRSLVVKKVPPGYSIKIFDYARAQLLERTEARSMLLSDGPYDPCSVRISLAKGWGPSYSRQFITSCPCWLEVLLGARRHSSTS